MTLRLTPAPPDHDALAADRFRQVSIELAQVIGPPAGARPVGRSAVRIVSPEARAVSARRLRLRHGVALAAVPALVFLGFALRADGVGPQPAPLRTTPPPVSSPGTRTLAPGPRPGPTEAPPPLAAAPVQPAARAQPAPAPPPPPAALPQSAAGPPPPRVRSDCDTLEDDERARCLYPAVLDADLRLRDAYDAAVREGAPNVVLARYRNDWARLRNRAENDPDRVIEIYHAMARELNALAGAEDDGWS